MVMTEQEVLTRDRVPEAETWDLSGIFAGVDSLRGAMDSVDGLMALAKSDADAGVRNAACHALGQLHDAKARPVLEDVAKSDGDSLVRDQAAIALRRL